VTRILDLTELGLLDLVLFKLPFDQAKGELRSQYGNGNTQLLEQVGQCSRVVLVTMCDHDAAKAIFALHHIRVVGQDEIHARVIVVGEHDSGIDHDHVVAILDDGHVLSDTIEPAEGYDAEAVSLLFGHRLE
jgi:hypothetical protein